MQVTFEFDLNQYRIDRDVYSVLDWIGDVGGLNEGLTILLGAILIFISFNPFEHYLIENLYKAEPERDGRRGRHESDLVVYEGGQKQGYVNLSDWNTWLVRQKLEDLFGCCFFYKLSCCKCMRLSRMERLFSRARDKHDKEVDIVRFLKKVRRLDAFYKRTRKRVDPKYPHLSTDDVIDVLSCSDGSDESKNAGRSKQAIEFSNELNDVIDKSEKRGLKQSTSKHYSFVQSQLHQSEIRKDQTVIADDTERESHLTATPKQKRPLHMRSSFAGRLNSSQGPDLDQLAEEVNHATSAHMTVIENGARQTDGLRQEMMAALEKGSL